MDELIQAITELKTKARRNILGHTATYHAICVLENIAGWEAAANSGDGTNLYKKVKQIYQEQVDKMSERVKL